MLEWPKSQMFEFYNCDICHNRIGSTAENGYYIPETKYWNIKKKVVYCSPEHSLMGYTNETNK